MQKSNVGAATEAFLGKFFFKHSPKLRVFVWALSDLECLLLQVATQQTDYKLFFNYPT
jgi:hypothetical protein